MTSKDKYKRDFQGLIATLPIDSLVKQWLPEGKMSGRNWVTLNPTRSDNKLGSFSINIDTGSWGDFATDDKGGDVISLYAYLHSVKNSEAYDVLSGDYRNTPLLVTKKPAKKEPSKVVILVPEGAPPLPDDDRIMQWEYRNHSGQLICYVARYNRHNRPKTIIPWTYLPDDSGNFKWQKKGPNGRKPLYNIIALIRKPDARVLLVEGEKAADAASRLLPDWACITWLGGSGSVNKVDFSLLAGRDVVCWPDNDKPGVKTMESAKKALKDIASSVGVIDLSWLGERVDTWDLADAEEEGATAEDVIKMIDKLDSQLGDFPDLSEKGRALNTTDNVYHLLDLHSVKLRYNLMTNFPEFYIPGMEFGGANEADCFRTEISNFCVKAGVPKVDLSDHILSVADRHRYHPAIEFINSKPWDGVTRVKDLLNTVKSENQMLSDKLIYRWLIGCVAAAFSEDGVSLEGILVFQGEGGIGKTHWFIKLLPDEWRHLGKDSLSLDPHDKDSVMDCTSCWLGELGEIDGTVKKSDVSAQKIFITKKIDYYRVPFGRSIRKVPRRTSFFGSVNPVEYLRDDTGNRRYWTVGVTSINHNHDIDMQQVWAEVKTLFDAGESYRLTDDELKLVNNQNEEFIPVDPLEEEILKRFRWEEPQRNNLMTVSEVLRCIGLNFEQIRKNHSSQKCGTILRKLTKGKGKKTNGRLVFPMPGEKFRDPI